MSESNSTADGGNSASDESNATSEETRGAVQHLEDALAVEDADEVNYHVRQALQLLDVEREQSSSDGS